MRAAWSFPRHLALIALAGVTSAGPLTAAGGSKPAPTQAGAVKGPEKSAEGPRRMTLDFVEAEITDVAKALSVQSGRNIAVSANAKGKVTLRLLATTLDDALRFVSQLAGLDFRLVGDTYVIGTAEELRAFAARSGVSDTWAPQHLTPAEAKDLVQAALPYVTVQAQEKSNQIVLLGTAEDVAAARKFLVDADIPGTGPRVVQTYKAKNQKPEALAALLGKSMPTLAVQVHDRSLILTGPATDNQRALQLISQLDGDDRTNKVSQVYQLKYISATTAKESIESVFAGQGEEKDKKRVTVIPGPETVAPRAANFSPLSIESKTTFAGAAAAPADANGAAGTKSRSLILTGASEDVAAAVTLLRSIDVAPAQVLIEARLVEVAPEKAKALGLQYDFLPVRFQEKRVIRGESSTTPSGDQGFNFGRFIRTPFDIDVTINLMQENRVAKLLANPRIAVIDNEDANIFIGDLLRYRILRSVTAGGSEQFDVETVPVGIALLVRPRVHDDGNITLKVHPVVSTVTSFIGPERIPQTASREADSTIRMKDGETVAIGGLIREEDVNIMTKVPGLGDLPLIGRLFTNKSSTHKRTEVTVFLTARILK